MAEEGVKKLRRRQNEQALVTNRIRGTGEGKRAQTGGTEGEQVWKGGGWAMVD